MTDYGGGIHLVKAAFPFNGRDEDEVQVIFIELTCTFSNENCMVFYEIVVVYEFANCFVLLVIYSFALKREIFLKSLRLVNSSLVN